MAAARFPLPTDIGTGAAARVRRSFWPVAQASLAAALAWLIAHRVLGHPQPFFAPIAAAVSLSTTHAQRSRRIIQMVVGVLLGIAVAEVLVAVLGTSSLAIGVTVLTTMLAALVVAAGFVGEGMMFVNQAAASAVLVVAFHRHGIGSERAVDAVIGGSCALLVGVVLFPAAPLPGMWLAERGVLGALADALGVVAERLSHGGTVPESWTRQTGFQIHELLGRLAVARATARVNVRVAPRRFGQRALVDAEDARIAGLDLLANAVLSLVRATTYALDDGQPVPPELADRIVALERALRKLARIPQPWPAELMQEIADVALTTLGDSPGVDRTPVIATIVKSAARDLQALAGG